MPIMFHCTFRPISMMGYETPDTLTNSKLKKLILVPFSWVSSFDSIIIASRGTSSDDGPLAAKKRRLASENDHAMANPSTSSQPNQDTAAASSANLDVFNEALNNELNDYHDPSPILGLSDDEDEHNDAQDEASEHASDIDVGVDEDDEDVGMQPQQDYGVQHENEDNEEEYLGTINDIIRLIKDATLDDGHS
ncbi:hypothetical protein NEOLEDRAFT_1182425 [Neolentinus lepideus HHB14362 ss-1]|uniref:Uncharacterized protein n=1 Tax=Neolentinus lepideus HHB14362 ss-1 TaxID=1314782 RepID=A0A165P624_9AGAM|nr:hypothetical protein NEOLEDRAFT_1182425 [Neolentinus lepideus HHB14362 ss-1]